MSFAGDGDYRRELFVSYSSLISVAGSLVALRLFAKWRFIHKIAPEDIVCLSSFVSCWLIAVHYIN